MSLTCILHVALDISDTHTLIHIHTHMHTQEVAETLITDKTQRNRFLNVVPANQPIPQAINVALDLTPCTLTGNHNNIFVNLYLETTKPDI